MASGGCECASGAANHSTGAGPSAATEDSAGGSATRRSDSGISGPPAPPAATVPVNDDSVARLVNNNLGYRRYHRQQ